MAALELWFNPACSKCRHTRERLDRAGQPYDLFEYLSTPPDRGRLEEVLALLGEPKNPAAIARTGDDAWRERGLEGASAESVLAALVADPRLIQRPIAVWKHRAVVCRPPERIDPLLAEIGGSQG